jgi:hypothetical protein
VPGEAGSEFLAPTFLRCLSCVALAVAAVLVSFTVLRLVCVLRDVAASPPGELDSLTGAEEDRGNSASRWVGTAVETSMVA